MILTGLTVTIIEKEEMMRKHRSPKAEKMTTKNKQISKDAVRKHGYQARVVTPHNEARCTSLTFENAHQTYLWNTGRSRSSLIKH